MTILLFNNRIYGLTKGQYSPTSETGKVTKSTPMGSLDHPFNPVSLALGAEATFVARTIDSDRKHLTAVLAAAAAHRGTSLVEIYQNCPIFNDGAFDAIKNPDTKADAIIPLVHGEPVTFGVLDGTGGAKALVRDEQTGGVKVVATADVDAADIVVHDAHSPDPTMAFAISRLTDAGYLNTSPIGIFRQVERSTYDDAAASRSRSRSGPRRRHRRPVRPAGGADRRRRHLDDPLTRPARRAGASVEVERPDLALGVAVAVGVVDLRAPLPATLLGRVDAGLEDTGVVGLDLLHGLPLAGAALLLEDLHLLVGVGQQRAVAPAAP